MAEHALVFGEVADRIDVGSGVTLLRFADDSHAPHDLGVEHVCQSWPDPQEPDGVFVKITAPALHPDHVVTGTPEAPTVRASIACPDCGLHGYVTEGRWASA